MQSLVSTTGITVVRIAFGALVLVGSLFAATGGNATLAAQDINARVDYRSLRCIHTTGEPGSDEVFVVGGWAKYSSDLEKVTAKGKVHLKPRKRVPVYPWGSSTPYYVYIYPHYGDVDDHEYVFKSRQVLWSGKLRNGECLMMQVATWEKDSGKSLATYAEEMSKSLAINLPFYVVGGVSPADIAYYTLRTIQFAIGAGENDRIGFFTIVLKNRNGVLVKELRPHVIKSKTITRKVNYLDIATKHELERMGFHVVKYEAPFYVMEYKLVVTYGYTKIESYEEMSRVYVDPYDYNAGILINYLKSKGYYLEKKVFTWDGVRYIYCKLIHNCYARSESGKTLGLQMRGDGPQHYYAKIQVRTGMTSSNPIGDAEVWTVVDKNLAR